MAEEQYLLKPRCSALLPTAQPNGAFNSAANSATWGAWNLELSSLRKVLGGLWVGGDLYVDKDTLLFTPNALNRMVHEGDVSVSISFADVTDVRHRFGLITGIVDVVAGGRRQSFRCYGATKLAAMLTQCLGDWHGDSDAAKSLHSPARTA